MTKLKLLLLTLLVLLIAAPSAMAGNIGMHSMLSVNSPTSLKQQMFADAAAAHAPEIRVDVDLNQISVLGSAFWSGMDEYHYLSAEYNMPVLADLPNDGLGAPDPTTYGNQIKWLATAEPWIKDFEVVNEPDGSWEYTGTPDQYATMLNVASWVLHPLGDRVVFGGIMQPNTTSWINQVLADNPTYDIGNVHLRGTLSQLQWWVTEWKGIFGSHPLWVTETGYPADPAYQYAPGYKYGVNAQNDFLAKSLPLLLTQASRVFVTERDNLSGQFASEGIIGRPAFLTVAKLNQ